jgi:hypothetical protein
VVVIAPELARVLSGNGNDNGIFIRNQELLEAIAERKEVQSAKALEYAKRSSEALANTAIPADAVDELEWQFSPGLHIEFAPSATSEECCLFPRSIKELADLSVTSRASPALPNIHVDWAATLLTASPNNPNAHFVVLRMSRNSLPQYGADGNRLQMEEAISLGRSQMRAAFEKAITSGLPADSMAYYEADIVFFQPRRATDRIPSVGVLKGLPFILVRIPETSPNSLSVKDVVESVYLFKKGSSN